LTGHLDLTDAIHVGRSTGGGEVVHYLARHGESRVAKAAIISAVPPLMVKSETNPGGLPKDVFDGFQAGRRARPAATRPLTVSRRRLHPCCSGLSVALVGQAWRQLIRGSAETHDSSRTSSR
jgi:non-heme chloroperoxidase